MIRINLLPHREAARKARREQFYVLAGLVSVLAVLVVFAGYTLIAGEIERQQGKNDFLKQEIAALEKQLGQIKNLKEQSQALLARKQVIENLQRDRNEPVHLLAELAQQMPEGVYLKALKQDGVQVSLSGYAQSNARVSTLMRNLDASPWLENPQLLESKAIVQNGRRVNEFSMNVSLTRAPGDDGKGKK